MATKKEQLNTKRDAMLALIKAHPGITSAEIAERLGMRDSSAVSTAMWTAIRSNRVMVERVARNGRSTNAHYLPDQVPPDAVERIQQKLVDVSEVIPSVKPAGARNSVFDVPRAAEDKKKGATSVRPPVDSATRTETRVPQIMSGEFSCAITCDGGLVLIRDGTIQASLSELETMKVQACLMKLAAGRFFATMA